MCGIYCVYKQSRSCQLPFCASPIFHFEIGDFSVYLYILQVNEKFFELKKGHIGIVEKAQETSSDSDMHNTVCLCHCSTS